MQLSSDLPTQSSRLEIEKNSHVEKSEHSITNDGLVELVNIVILYVRKNGAGRRTRVYKFQPQNIWLQFQTSSLLIPVETVFNSKQEFM